MPARKPRASRKDTASFLSGGETPLGQQGQARTPVLLTQDRTDGRAIHAGEFHWQA
jgi:hypothetical protein